MTVQTQIPDFTAARRAMIENQLRPQGVTDHATLAAMGAIKREEFLPPETRPLAYADRSVAIGEGRFLTAPAALAQLLTQMMPEAGQRALVVGAGTGYALAVLRHAGVEAIGLESDPALAARAREHGFEVVDGPLEAGHDGGAPYDLILIDGAVGFIPEALIGQLADGGHVGTALIERGVSRLIVGRKSGNAFGYLSIGDAGVASLPGFQRPQGFTF